MAQPPTDGASPAGRQQWSTLEQRLTAIAEPLADALGIELLEVNVKGHTGRRLVRVVVDAEQGIDIDTCAALSRSVAGTMDEVDAVAGRYTLEVTSPGINRPLRSERDFRRSIRRPVRVVVRPEPDRIREITGIVAAVGDGVLTLDADGEMIRLRLADVEYGRVQLPW